MPPHPNQRGAQGPAPPLLPGPSTGPAQIRRKDGEVQGGWEWREEERGEGEGVARVLSSHSAHLHPLLWGTFKEQAVPSEVRRVTGRACHSLLALAVTPVSAAQLGGCGGAPCSHTALGARTHATWQTLLLPAPCPPLLSGGAQRGPGVSCPVPRGPLPSPGGHSS